jgi:hypothetical protein
LDTSHILVIEPFSDCYKTLLLHDEALWK